MPSRLGIEAIVVGVLLLALGAAGMMVSHYKDKAVEVQKEYDRYQAAVVAEGKLAQARHEAEIAKSKMETQNVQTKLDSSIATVQRVLSDAAKARSSGGYLPPVPPGTASADVRTCFDRPKLDAALSAFGTGIAGLIGEGAIAVIKRDGWHKWYDAQVAIFKASASETK